MRAGSVQTHSVETKVTWVGRRPLPLNGNKPAFARSILRPLTLNQRVFRRASHPHKISRGTFSMRGLTYRRHQRQRAKAPRTPIPPPDRRPGTPLDHPETGRASGRRPQALLMRDVRQSATPLRRGHHARAANVLVGCPKPPLSACRPVPVCPAPDQRSGRRWHNRPNVEPAEPAFCPLAFFLTHPTPSVTPVYYLNTLRDHLKRAVDRPARSDDARLARREEMRCRGSGWP